MIKQLFRGSVVSALFIGLTLSSFGCVGEDGLDGEDGNAYIAISWFTTPNWATWTDPAIPGTVTNAQPYSTSVGQYSVAYETAFGDQYSIDYTIYIDEGTPGEPGTAIMIDGEDGVDGDDIWFEVYLWLSGPSFYAWSSQNSLGKSILQKSEKALLGNTSRDNFSVQPTIRQIEFDYDRHMDAMLSQEPTVISGTKGRYGYTMKYVRVK